MNSTKEQLAKYTEAGRQLVSNISKGYLPAKVVNPFLSSEAEERLI